MLDGTDTQGVTPGADSTEPARPTRRLGLWPVRTVRRHPGTSVLAAGALLALGGGAILGGLAKPVPVSLPGTHTIIVDRAAHSASQPGTASPPSTSPPPSADPASPPSSVGLPAAGAPAPVAAPGPSSGTPGGSGQDQGTPIRSVEPDAAGRSIVTGDRPVRERHASSVDGSTRQRRDGPEPATGHQTTPPTTPPSGGPGSGGLGGVLSGLLGPVLGPH